MMIYFISDVHLGVLERSQDKPREDMLLNLLDKISKDAEKIYLVGDIFDYWFDYKSAIPRNFYRVLSKLHDIRRDVCEIEFLMGNHDFGHLNFFEDELNIPVHSGDILREHHGKKFYISHGDGKDPRDKGYLMLKKIMRNNFTLWAYLKLHPNTGIGLASGSSKESRKYTTKKEFGEGDAMFEFAKSKIDSGFDYIVMGHRHKSTMQQYRDGFYLNIGEWIKEPKIVAFDSKDIFHINVKEFLSL